MEERIKPKILNSQIIHKVNDYHTQIVNVSRLASVLIAGQDMYILEVAPAGYIILAANEAEKSANITLVDCRTFGAVGRLYLGGKESDIARAAQAAESAILGVHGKESSSSTRVVRQNAGRNSAARCSAGGGRTLSTVLQ